MSRWEIYTEDGSRRTDTQGNAVLTTTLEYSGRRMADRMCVVKIVNPYPIDFEVGDYLSWRGEKFLLNEVPGVKKIARKGTYGESFTYEGMKFLSHGTAELETEFLDYVLSDNLIHYTSLPNISFYAENVDDLLDRIQANLDQMYPQPTELADYDEGSVLTFTGNTRQYFCYNKESVEAGVAPQDSLSVDFMLIFKQGSTYITFTHTVGNDDTQFEYNTTTDDQDTWIVEQWEAATKYDVSYEPWLVFSPSLIRSKQRNILITNANWMANYGNDTTEPTYEITKQNVVLDNQTIRGALNMVDSLFKLRFIEKGRTIVVEGQNTTLRTLMYGKGKGLYEINRVADTSQEMWATRIRAFGSQTNLPVRYYNNASLVPWATMWWNEEDTPRPANNYRTSSWAAEEDRGEYAWWYGPYIGVDRYDKYLFDYLGTGATRLHNEAGSTPSAPWVAEYNFFNNGGGGGNYYKNPIVYRPFWISDIPVKGKSGTHIRKAYSVVYYYLMEERITEEHTTAHWPEDYGIGGYRICYQVGDGELDFNVEHDETYYNATLYVAFGAFDYSIWPRTRLASMSTALNDNMAVLNLMLPGFPNVSLYDWVLEHGGTAVTDSRNDAHSGRATWVYNEETFDAFFSKEIHNPFIESLNKTEYGVKRQTLRFDGSMDGLDDIYASLKEVTIGDIKESDTQDDFGLYIDELVKDTPKELWPDTQRVDEVVAVEAPTNGLDDGLVYNTSEGTETTYFPDTDTTGEMQSTLYLRIPPLGFDLASAISAAGADAKISFLDGMNGGREFSITNVERYTPSNDPFALTITYKREPDSSTGRVYPYHDYPITAMGTGVEGDHFVLLGISMPPNLIDVASIKMLFASLEWLAKNDKQRNIYEVKISEQYMQREQDRVDATREDDPTSTIKSTYETIDVDDVFVVRDSDLGNIAARVETLTIKENESGGIPVYDVTLKSDEDLTVPSSGGIFSIEFDETFD